MTVAWTSALPIKLALVRQAIGPDAPLPGPIPPDLGDFLVQDEPYYAVTLLGLPPSFAALAPRVDALKAETRLERKNKEPIAPENIQLFRDADQSIRVVYVFAKTDAITLDDKDVEFITKLGGVTEVKKKFKLADMLFGDQLAL